MQVPVTDIIKVIAAATLFVVVLASFVVLLVKLFDKARRNFALEKENINKEFETQLLKTQLEIQEQTLHTVSQEIHDNIGQALSFVKLIINTVDMDRQDEVQSRLLEAKGLLTKTIQDLRNLSKTLNAGYIIETGIVAAIEYQLSFLQRTGMYTATLQVSEAFYKIPAYTELVLFRMVQELLNNTIKHAEATEIAVQLDYREDKLVVAVNDNGRGFVAGGDSPKGLGLTNMRDRITLVQGTINIDSAPGNGTRVLIEVPRQAT